MRPAAKQQSMGQLCRRDLAVAFPCGGFAALIIDPKLADDSDQDGVSTISLSYTFYPVRGSAPSAAESAPPPAHGPARQLAPHLREKEKFVPRAAAVAAKWRR
jgi:hypothetical protein